MLHSFDLLDSAAPGSRQNIAPRLMVGDRVRLWDGACGQVMHLPPYGDASIMLDSGRWIAADLELDIAALLISGAGR